MRRRREGKRERGKERGEVRVGERGRGRGVGDRGRESEGDGVREGEREGVLKLRAKRSTPISVRKPCAPNYDAPPLTQPPQGGNVPSYLPPAPKSFSDFYEILQILSLKQKNLAYFRKSAKSSLYRIKIQLQVQNRGYFVKKNVPQIT